MREAFAPEGRGFRHPKGDTLSAHGGCKPRRRRGGTASGGCGRLYRARRTRLSAFAPQCRFHCATATVPPAAPSFLSQEKRWWRKECLGTRNSADAQKSILLHCAYYRFSFRSPNALRVTRPILYTGISHRGKYLTYGNREIFVLLRVVGADAHISPLHSGSMWASTPTSLKISEGAPNFIRQIFNGR